MVNGISERTSIHSCEHVFHLQASVSQSFSSLLSPQSFDLSQRSDALMQRPFVHLY